MKIPAFFKTFFANKTIPGKSIQDFINTPQDITHLFTPSSFEESSSGSYSSHVLNETLLSVISEFADQYIQKLEPKTLEDKKVHLINTLVNFTYQKMHFTSSQTFKIPDQKSFLPVKNDESVTDYFGHQQYRKKLTQQEAELFYNELTCSKVVDAMLEKLTTSFMTDLHEADKMDNAEAIFKRLVCLAGNHRDKFPVSDLLNKFYGFYTVEKLKTGPLNPEQKKIIKEEGVDKALWNIELYNQQGSEAYYKLLKNVCAALEDYPIVKLDALSKTERKCYQLITKELFEKLGVGDAKECASPQTILQYIHEELMKLLKGRNECKEVKVVTPQMRREQQLKAISRRLEQSSAINEVASFFGNGKVLAVGSNINLTQFCTLDQILCDPVSGKKVKTHDDMQEELRQLIYFILLEGNHIKLDAYKTLRLQERNKSFWFFPQSLALSFAEALNPSLNKTCQKNVISKEDVDMINEFLQPPSNNKNVASPARALEAKR